MKEGLLYGSPTIARNRLFRKIIQIREGERQSGFLVLFQSADAGVLISTETPYPIVNLSWSLASRLT